MGESFGKFLSTPLGSFLRVVLGAVLAAVVVILTDGKGEGITDIADLGWLNGVLGLAVAGGVPVLIAALNRQDPRFGNVIETPVTPPTSD